MPSVLVPLAQGCEELEAVTIIDLLRRAGLDVVTAGLDNRPVTASRGTLLIADTRLEDVVERTFDMIVLPGGLPGADHLAEDPRIVALLRSQHAAGRFSAAICAAPKVLACAGLLDGRSATVYPGAVDPAAYPKVEFTDAAVVVDGTIVTSRGPGTAMDFALQLIELLLGRESRDQVERGLVRTL
ncbi:DJ-1 family glyoxalase III [Thiocapsa roseopersicina]|uniref:4-methyl-5(B-hydroxyethyl)-thiazole monophosphate biosynthesis n=1 Tax=Thiocapsa roseopersicina TaxID=1058 RepID=A0A1H2ZCV9_THIRO|nr:DJ-1 family glyoxalase III [Thiocapsa roseopersicina]SDX15332.1 4-methyl-5(b-hydroxyethyl)-thiazole monophosphate biosynthesis [Thiocapsa roseopersicina]